LPEVVVKVSDANQTATVIKPVKVVEGAGVRLRRNFPTDALDHVDPFLLLDDFSSENPVDYAPGFPWHPHRGIETVTYVLSGSVHHRDSLGNAGRIGAGEVQWMTAGSGVMHEEMPDETRAPLVGFQLWISLPARLKMTAPRYRSIAADAIPEVPLGGGATARLIAGEVGGVRGPVVGAAVAPLYLDVRLAPGASTTHAGAPAGAALLYLFEGSIEIGEDLRLKAPRLGVFRRHADRIAVRSADGARYLLVAGTPLGEPIARHGPFVMNTPEEIETALLDLHRGTFIREKPEGAPRRS
jgi:quercetin 2,3-dioxygenase